MNDVAIAGGGAALIIFLTAVLKGIFDHAGRPLDDGQIRTASSAIGALIALAAVLLGWTPEEADAYLSVGAGVLSGIGAATIANWIYNGYRLIRPKRPAATHITATIEEIRSSSHGDLP